MSMRLFQWLMDWLFPDKCILCGRVLEREELDLCRECRIDGPECPISKIKYPYIDQWIALWYYEGNVRQSLLRYKFHNRRSYAAGYGRLLGMKLMKEDALDFDVLTWVPISNRRLRQRGYDQVALLAEKLGETLQIEAVKTLAKIRDNPKQSQIVGIAQRRANVLGAYEVIDPSLVSGKRVLLLDDILTTGATACECARVLLTAGATEVQFAAIAAANKNKSDRGSL
jgi:ComF family protein